MAVRRARRGRSVYVEELVGAEEDADPCGPCVDGAVWFLEGGVAGGVEEGGGEGEFCG
jgi:hypothetical protein